MLKEIAGSCLCGTVKFAVHGPFDAFHFCHCTRCRKSTGSAHAANIFTSADNIRWISGGDSIKRYNLPTAEFFAKCFCTECGSTVPYVSRRGPIIVIPAGTLESDPEVAPQDNIYWSDRASWYDAGKDAPCIMAAP